jgi:tyrosinase
MVNKTIPEEFDVSQRDELRRAADAWRLPYWDWAIPKPDWRDPTNKSKFGPNVPKIITMKNVVVRTRTGTAEVANPMWQFVLPQPPDGTATMSTYGVNFQFEENQEDQEDVSSMREDN